MKCSECGGLLRRQRGPLTLPDPYINSYSIEDAEYLVCGRCGEVLLSDSVAQQLEAARAGKLEELLRQQPIGAFVTASEAGNMLGISRQALHKHRRIRRGFIFHIRLGEGVVYLRESVARFLTNGDGRFRLTPGAQAAEALPCGRRSASTATSTRERRPHRRSDSQVAARPSKQA